MYGLVKKEWRDHAVMQIVGCLKWKVKIYDCCFQMWTLRCIPDPSSLLLLLGGPFKKVGFSSYHLQKILWFFNSRVWKLLWKADTDHHKGRLPTESKILMSVVLSVRGKLKTLVFLAIFSHLPTRRQFHQDLPPSPKHHGYCRRQVLSSFDTWTGNITHYMHLKSLKLSLVRSGQTVDHNVAVLRLFTVNFSWHFYSRPGSGLPQDLCDLSGQGDNLFWLQGNKQFC